LSGAGDLVLGVDASTTAVKALLVDRRGAVLAEGRAPVPLESPGPEAWEQDAETWWTALVEAVRGAVRGGAGPRVGALSIACQRETFVACDAAGTPLAPAITWMDSRARPEVAEVKREADEAHIHALSGKPACVTPSLYKIRFLLGRARPDLDAPTLFDVHGFLVKRLTGESATSLAAADPLGLVDMTSHTWSPELCRLARADRDKLPALVPPGARIAPLRAEVAASLGLSPEAFVVAGAGDGQAAGLGAGLVGSEPVAYMNLGTALVSGLVGRSYAIDRAFRTLYGPVPGTYFYETDLKGGTFTLDWLVDRLTRSDDAALVGGEDRARRLADLEARAEALPPGSSGLVTVPYLLGVMNPIWDDDAAGVLLGLRGDHGPAHLYRSIVEGLAFEARHHLEGVARATRSIEEIVVMGGASRSDLVVSIFADVLGVPFVRAGTSEATGLGAAILAGAALGWHGSIAGAARAMSSRGGSIRPSPRRETYDRLYREVYDGLFASVRARMTRLAELTRAV
jgi:xylulokinase